ncbi:tetratricopeptide repeat protein [Schlesneria sp. T3-172]|uniref:tetratricopeptide repeat protein n=1 Tax=Schlesneria sphaerica TaxID=3373610 RepID=UPI0037C58D80
MKAETAKIGIGLLEQLIALARARQWGEAARLAGEAWAADTENGRLCEVAGLFERAAQNYFAGRRRLERAMLFVPLRPSTWCALADCYLQSGLYRDARDIYASVANGPEVPADILRYCASRLDSLNESPRALEVARRVVAMQSDHAQSVYEFGYYLARSGATASLVMSVMKRAISLAPEKAIYRLGLAKIVAETGDLSRALDWVRHLSASQLDQIECRCCLERLAFLYEAGVDPVRAHACRVRMDNLPADSIPPTAIAPYLLVSEFLAEAQAACRAEVLSVG